MTKKWKNSEKSGKKSQANVKKSQKCKFRRQKLVNLNNQISKVITTSKYLDQDAGDGLWPNHYHYAQIH